MKHLHALFLILLIAILLAGPAPAQAQPARAASSPQAFPWQPSEAVDQGAAGDEQYSPALAVDGAGAAYAVWTNYRDGDYDIYFAYRPAGGAWSASQRVNDDPGNARQNDAVIAVDGAGAAYAAWEDRRNGDSDIYFAYRPAGGDWSANERVDDDPGRARQLSPALAVDGADTVYAIWRDERSGGRDIRFALRPAGGDWSASEQVNDDPGSAGQLTPALAVDATGNAYAAWQDRRNANGDIYFAMRPAGGSWGANERVNDDRGNAGQLTPTLAVDEAGNAYAVWEDRRNANDYDVYFATRPTGGVWSANQRVNDDPAGANQFAPVLAVDGAGAAHAAWQDERNGDPDIYFALRPAGGDWSANGRIDDDVGGAGQEEPAIALDDAGAAYALWEDERQGMPRIYFSYAAGDCLAVPGDLNCDGSVDVVDVQIIANAWSGDDLYLDLDGDGDVDIADVQRVAGLWGSP